MISIAIKQPTRHHNNYIDTKQTDEHNLMGYRLTDYYLRV